MEKNELTVLLRRMISGDAAAGEEALRLTYPRLRQIAHAVMSSESLAKTLQPTALVNELYLRHLKDLDLSIKDRQHFYYLAARGMRRILIDSARARRASKRDASQQVFPPGLPHWAQLNPDDILALDAALANLEKQDPRAASVVELRYILGCTQDETAQLLGLSARTVRDDWDYARVRLRSLIDGG
jgi:RNA polymerase sigma factor (TIGR02999 family)